MPSSRYRDAGRVIHPRITGWILVSAQPAVRCRRVYESLQGRPEVGPLPTPRRCHTACGGLEFTDVSPVFTLPLRAKATIVLIEPASASPPPLALHAYPHLLI
jgi:hypothetical protein